MTGPHVDPELLAAYALGALDANQTDDRASIHAHLASCDVCQEELAELQRVTAAATLAGHPSTDALPPSLRARTIARATGDASARTSTVTNFRQTSTAPSDGRRDRRWLSPGLALAASLLLAVGLGAYALSLRSQIAHLRDTVGLLSAQTDTLRERLERERRETATLINTVDVLRAPDTVRIDLRGAAAAAAGATGRAFLSARGRPFRPAACISCG
jgi:anti-sigma factor RsiW